MLRIIVLTILVQKVVRFHFMREMGRAPSGPKTYLTPISLHAFRSETPQLGPMHFKYEKIFLGLI